MTISQGDTERLERLADPARTHRQLAQDAKQARDAAILDAHTSGATLKELADATGLSTSTVHRIVLTEAERRQHPTAEA